MLWKKALIVLTAATVTLAGVSSGVSEPAHAAGPTPGIGALEPGSAFRAAPAATARGSLVDGSAPSPAIGEPISYSAYLPAGYDPAGKTSYPTVYLLHGRGDTRSGWKQVAADLDELIAAGKIPPVIAIMPDAPWSAGGGYYTDSLYTGGGAAGRGKAVETGFTVDLLSHVDKNYRTVPERDARIVAGYSMGGAGALRFTTAHQDLFSGAIVLSPAVYVPSTPVDSSTREFGAYGVGEALYDEKRYQELAYPAGFAALDPALPIHLFIAVGDDEYANPAPEDAIHDLDYEAATLYNRAKRVTGVSAELRVYDGGHEWGVWQRGFREGMIDFAGYLSTAPATPFTGTQLGSAGDDRAGGVVGLADGSTVQALAVAGSIEGHPGAGAMDIIVRKSAKDGSLIWSTAIATAANERAYGLTESVVKGVSTGTILAGFIRLDHGASGSNDDALVAKIDPAGKELWRTTFGSERAADRLYASAAAPDGGIYATGYTSGALEGAQSAGDKDAILVRVDPEGTVKWSAQLGGTGEDKGFAVATRADGGAYIAGVSGSPIPGSTAITEGSLGGADAWVAAYSESGILEWVRSLGTPVTDQASALVATPGGVVVTGFTKGDLGGASAGDNDLFAAAISTAGTLEWITQIGTDGDDRAAAIVQDARGNTLIAGHTSGRMGAPVGGVDLFTVVLDAAGKETQRTQFGTRQRDGADEWDESNLYLAPGTAGKTLLQGLTYGAVAGASSAGLGDVFLTELPFAAAAPIGAPVVDGGTVVPPEKPGEGAVTPPGVIPPTPGVLGETGTAIAKAAVLATLLIAAGWALRRRFRRSGQIAVTPQS